MTYDVAFKRLVSLVGLVALVWLLTHPALQSVPAFLVAAVMAGIVPADKALERLGVGGGK